MPVQKKGISRNERRNPIFDAVSQTETLKTAK